MTEKSAAQAIQAVSISPVLYYVLLMIMHLGILKCRVEKSSLLFESCITVNFAIFKGSSHLLFTVSDCTGKALSFTLD